MTNKHKKVPSLATSRADKKQVRIVSDVPRETPSWMFSRVDRGGPFEWPVNQSDELRILEKLRSFETMKWAEIEGNDHHLIPIENLSKLAQERLLEIKLDDIDAVFSFHYSGKARIIGIRDRSVLKLLWWDPEHQVCLSHKKHT